MSTDVKKEKTVVAARNALMRLNLRRAYEKLALATLSAAQFSVVKERLMEEITRYDPILADELRAWEQR